MAKKEYSYNETEWYRIPCYKVKLIREETLKYKENIKNPDDVANMVKQYLEGADREIFVAIFLDRKNNIIGINTVSIGTVSSSIVHPREVFKPAIVLGASAIIVSHNHPSGNPEPSKDDIELTKKLVNAGEVIGIEVLDHIIIGDGFNFSSFKSLGYI